MNNKVNLGLQETGVPGLDTLLGGGLVEFSFNVIAGVPGCGKTTLAHQIMFGLASPQRKALFFTVLGEPTLKMLRYQQQFSFFDIDKVDQCVRYVNLTEDLRTGDFSGVLERITKEVADFSPALVFVDSFRSVIQTAKSGNEGVTELQYFVQELGTRMTGWQATTFLIGEYGYGDSEANPIMTIADGLIWMTHNIEQNSAVRKIHIVKMRGLPHFSGAHTFRITNDGVQIFPRQLPPLPNDEESGDEDEDLQRLSIGIPELDVMLCGGLPQGHAALVVGPSGSGKTILGNAFLSEGVRNGENGVVVSFEKGPSRLRNASLTHMVRSGQVAVIASRSLDLSLEEILHDLLERVERTEAKRVVIDSLSELGLYLSPEAQKDFREAVFRILATLAGMGVTVVVTMGLEDRFTELSFSQSDTSFLVDAIIAMRYVETGGRLEKAICVVKLRGSDHSNDIRHYTVSERGMEIDSQPIQLEGILSGRPTAIKQAT